MSEHPKELFEDEKWDRLIDLSLRRTVYGLLGGSLVALTLLREWCCQQHASCSIRAAAAALPPAACKCLTARKSCLLQHPTIQTDGMQMQFHQPPTGPAVLVAAASHQPQLS
jgi:hypothetical protein